MFLSFIGFLRFVIAWLDLALLTIVMYLLSWLPEKLTQKWYPKIFTYWSWVFVRALGVNLKLHQKNHRPIPKQYIVISNHPSAFEDVGMPALFKARYLAKMEVKNWWIVGRISKACGTLYVERECKTSRKGAQDKLLETLAKGDSVGLYPEGGCKGRRIHLPFRYGVFEISLKSEVPILPVFLHYETQEDFEWQHQHLLKKLWMIIRSQNRTANYYVYDAIYPNQFNNKEEYCAYVQDLYLDLQKRYLD